MVVKRCKNHSVVAGLVVVIALASILSACAPAPTATGPYEGMVQGTIWVANEEGGSITVIDAKTNKVVTTLTGLRGPHNLQVAPEGKVVWVVSGHDALAVMLDAVTYEVRGTVSTGKEPAHIVVTPDGKTAYVTNGGVTR